MIERGEKIALVGRNGEGKTTVRTDAYRRTRTHGRIVRIGHNINTGYYAQNQDDLMDGEASRCTIPRPGPRWGDIRTRLRDILGAFLFRGART